MNYIEYGKDNAEVIMLLHGGGLSWWNYREAAKILSARYRVILPILDGHAESDLDFTTIEDNALEIINFIDTKFGGSIALLAGVSLGAQIALEILSLKSTICRFALIESALVKPMRIAASLISPMINLSYGLIKRKWFSKLQFKSLKIKEELYSDYFKDTCAITKKNMIAFLKANSLYKLKKQLADTEAEIYVFVGAKERKNMLRSAQTICNTVKDSHLKILKDRYHGEFSLNYAEEYAEKTDRILSGRLD
ncbi:MAG: alpha/beta hydrolase [Clostridia bacterium]|nr:alpha/beta hydrolase [Clostridia bacterium]